MEPPAQERAGDLARAQALYAQLDPDWFDEANDPEAWLTEPAVQEMIASLVEEAVAPYRPLVAPDALAAMQDEVTLACVTDSTTIEYLKRLRPPPERDGSGKVRKGKLGGAKVVAFPSKKAGGERP
jgi:hypothetical protein